MIGLTHNNGSCALTYSTSKHLLPRYSAWNRFSAFTDITSAVTKALNARDIDGMTPLHISAGFGHRKATRVLLWAGVNEYATTKLGKTPYDLVGAWVTLEHRQPRTEDAIRQMLLQVSERSANANIRRRRVYPQLVGRQNIHGCLFCGLVPLYLQVLRAGGKAAHP